MTAHRTGTPSELPSWLHSLAAAVQDLSSNALTSFVPPPGATPRAAAVLILFGDGSHGRHVLLLERASTMRSHAGQVAFPGGAADADDADAAATALREAEEETALDVRGVEVIATLPPVWLPPSNFEVTPVVAWWRSPSPVRAVDASETASVHVVALEALLDPANRATVRHPSGYLGPAFVLPDLLVWGFTALLLDRLFDLVEWQRPWDEAVIVDLPDALVASSLRDIDRATNRT